MPSLSLSSLQIPLIGTGFPPSSQKAGERPISFVLVDNAVPGGYATSFSLTIRPEELTRTDVSRMTVQQTLGGAWADDFGPGLASINITGHTGWRGVAGLDGMDLFAALKAQVFDSWHARRAQARASGLDPAQVELVFSDALDSTTDVVAPVNFVLRRSKSRPLLMQFQISMVSLNMPQAAPSDDALGSFIEALGLESMNDSIGSITMATDDIGSFTPADLTNPVRGFMTTSVGALNKVIASVNSATGVGQIIGTAQAIAQCGQNAFHTIAAIASLPANISAQLMSVASWYSNAFCVLKNAINTKRIFHNYTSLLGASNCSSTSGGSPASAYQLTGTNPFYDVIGSAGTPPISVTPAAQSAMQRLINTDPVLSGMSNRALSSTLTTINSGITVPQ